jgi:RNA polymerase sigma-70 factor (ECF subfamily)
MGAPPQTRSSLLLRIRNPGDSEAWDEFAGIGTPLIHRYCQRRGLQDAGAADVVQEVMLAVSKAIERFEKNPINGSFRSWLFTITHHTFADFLDRRSRGPQGGGGGGGGGGGSTVRRIVEALPDPVADGLWDREYQRWMFDWACRQVPGGFEETTWQAFWRTAVDSLKGDEVARALGISQCAVTTARRQSPRNWSAFLGDEPILARPAGAAEKLWRWSRRNPMAAALAGSVALRLMVVAVVSTVAAIRIARARERERSLRLIAERNAKEETLQRTRAE